MSTMILSFWQPFLTLLVRYGFRMIIIPYLEWIELQYKSQFYSTNNNLIVNINFFALFLIFEWKTIL